MAAVLYEIDEGEIDTKIPVNYLEKVQEQNKELQEIIARIPIEELQEIVFSQAASDDFLYNKIMAKYAPITPCHMIRLKKQVIDYMEDYIRDFLLNEFHDEEMLRKKLYILDEKITKFQKENYSGDSYSAYYGMVNNITARIRLMEELNYSKQEIRDYR